MNEPALTLLILCVGLTGVILGWKIGWLMRSARAARVKGRELEDLSAQFFQEEQP